MVILIIMAIGVWIGFKWFPEKWQKHNSIVQLLSIITLIFCMGVSLGSNPNFLNELTQLGIKGLVFAIIPIIFSILMVYILSLKFLKEKEDDHSGSH